ILHGAQTPWATWWGCDPQGAGLLPARGVGGLRVLLRRIGAASSYARARSWSSNRQPTKARCTAKGGSRLRRASTMYFLPDGALEMRGELTTSIQRGGQPGCSRLLGINLSNAIRFSATLSPPCTRSR